MPPRPVPTAQPDGCLALTVEQSNALRASLGLKPLAITPPASPRGSTPNDAAGAPPPRPPADGRSSDTPVDAAAVAASAAAARRRAADAAAAAARRASAAVLAPAGLGDADSDASDGDRKSVV